MAILRLAFSWKPCRGNDCSRGQAHDGIRRGGEEIHVKRLFDKFDDWVFWHVEDPLFDFLMAHELAVRIVSSIVGALLGCWLTWFILMPLIVQR